MERMKEVSKRVRERKRKSVTLWNLYLGFSTKNDLAERDLSSGQHADDTLSLECAHTHTHTERSQY